MQKRRTYLVHIECDEDRPTNPLINHIAKQVASTYKVHVEVDRCRPAPIGAFMATERVCDYDGSN